MQPTKTEKTINFISNFTEEITGDKIESIPERDKSQQVIMITIGSIFFVIGLIMILKSGKN